VLDANAKDEAIQALTAVRDELQAPPPPAEVVAA
jgi:hypothetical protein